MAYAVTPNEKRFWAKVERGAADACWSWRAGRFSDGYGHFSERQVDGRFRSVRAHRYAYSIAVGAVAGGLQVLHRCDNPPCCNPAHLFLGTGADNMKDKCNKGRHRGASAGERHHMAKLTTKDVMELRAMVAQGLPYRQIAPRFGITEDYVGQVANRVTWRTL